MNQSKNENEYVEGKEIAKYMKYLLYNVAARHLEILTMSCMCEGLLGDLAGGHVPSLLDPLGIFKPKGDSQASSNAHALGGGFNFGPIGINGGISSASSSASANGGGSASASAKADAQANGYGGYGGSNANAHASANANAQGKFVFGAKK